MKSREETAVLAVGYWNLSWEGTFQRSVPLSKACFQRNVSWFFALLATVTLVVLTKSKISYCIKLDLTISKSFIDHDY